MFKNYLTVAIRNLMRHRLYSAINVIGLAIGMACFVLMGLYVYHEMQYDSLGNWSIAPRRVGVFYQTHLKVTACGFLYKNS